MEIENGKPVADGIYADRRLRFGTMRLSVIEGCFAVIALGLQQAFYVPYLHQLGASNLQIGIGAGIPTLMTGLVQIWAPVLLLHTRAYRKIVVISTFAQALCFVPFALVYYIVPNHPVWYSITAMGISAIGAGFGAAAWSDWMSYVVPRRRRGKYFALRNRIVTIIQLVISIIASRMLDTVAGKMMMIFTLIWFAAFISRTMSSIFFMYHYEPDQIKTQVRIRGSFTDFLRGIFSTPLGRFAAGFSLMNFAVNFSGPFLVVHMLGDLNYSYTQCTAIQLTQAAAMIATVGLWGRLCDKIGNILPLRVTATATMANLLAWIVTQNFWILFAVSVISGITWAGFTLTTFNYTIGAVEPARRTTYIAYLNVVSSVCIFAGSALGGLVGPLLPAFSKYQLHSVFLFSTLFRLAPLILFQTVPEDKPSRTKMTAVERFFFDPRLTLRMGFFRPGFGRDKRPL